MKRFYQKNKKTIHVVGGITLSIVVLAFLLPKRDTTGGQSYIDDSGSTTPGGGQANSFPASDVANQLYTIMSGLGWTRSADILNVFATRVPRTNTAFEALKQAFGKRQHNQVTGGTSFGKSRDLIEWLEHEMNSTHYETLKSFFPNQPWI